MEKYVTETEATQNAGIFYPGVPINILQNRPVCLVVWHAVSTLSYLMLLPSGTVHKYSLSIN